MREKITVIVSRHSGAHLIKPTIKHLGFKCYSAKGDRELALEPIPGRPLLVWLRNPRNTLISAFRWKGAKEPDDRALAAFIVAQKNGRTPLSFLQAWAERWVDYAGSVQVRFEDMILPSGIDLVRGMAKLWNAPNEPDEVFNRHYRNGTFTGRHSDWRAWFGPRTLDVYAGKGGLRLDKVMGYA